LVLAGFGGHAVVPGLARDMKHPGDFERVINRAFVSQRRGAKRRVEGEVTSRGREVTREWS
jgi:hypothetical protein